MVALASHRMSVCVCVWFGGAQCCFVLSLLSYFELAIRNSYLHNMFRKLGIKSEIVDFIILSSTNTRSLINTGPLSTGECNELNCVPLNSILKFILTSKNNDVLKKEVKRKLIGGAGTQRNAFHREEVGGRWR